LLAATLVSTVKDDDEDGQAGCFSTLSLCSVTSELMVTQILAGGVEREVPKNTFQTS
jgi:hypothetical protein